MIYVALFRGINVGGKNKIKMADLRQLFIDVGYEKIKSYIQSGNVIFESALNKELLLEKIKIEFHRRFGFKCNIILRSVDEFEDIIQSLPFTLHEINQVESVNPDVTHLYLYFLDKMIEKQNQKCICSDYVGEDKISFGKNEIYFLCEQSIRNSKLATCISKNFPTATARNWNTINKVYNLMLGF